MPVNRKAHHTQLPATPLRRTISVIRFGVSHEKVQATIETPSRHHGMFRPERKNDSVFCPARRAAQEPTSTTDARNPKMIHASNTVIVIMHHSEWET